MSIHPTEWSKPDEDDNKPDVNMLHDRYFNTDDGYIWRIDDFVMVQTTGMTVDVSPKGENLGYQEQRPGKVLWHVILKREGDENKARLGMLYADFDLSTTYHKVKDPSGKPKPVYRGLDISDPAPRIAVVRGGPRHNEPDERRRHVDVGQVRDDASVGRTVELSSRQRPSSVDHSTGPTRGVVKGPNNQDPGSANFDYTGDSVMLEERENPSGDWKPSPMERERLRGGSGA